MPRHRKHFSAHITAITMVKLMWDLALTNDTPYLHVLREFFNKEDRNISRALFFRVSSDLNDFTRVLAYLAALLKMADVLSRDLLAF